MPASDADNGLAFDESRVVAATFQPPVQPTACQDRQGPQTLLGTHVIPKSIESSYQIHHTTEIFSFACILVMSNKARTNTNDIVYGRQ